MRFAGSIFSGCALALTGAWALALAVAGSTDVLFYLAPALLILAPLLAGRYVGEELIERVAARWTPRARRIAAPAPTPRTPVLSLPRGTRLLAFALATRPPPRLALLRT